MALSFLRNVYPIVAYKLDLSQHAALIYDLVMFKYNFGKCVAVFVSMVSFMYICRGRLLILATTDIGDIYCVLTIISFKVGADNS